MFCAGFRKKIFTGVFSFVFPGLIQLLMFGDVENLKFNLADDTCFSFLRNQFRWT